MFSARELKAFAIECGADIVAIGPVDRLEGAPTQMDPRHAMPSARTIVGFGFRHARGVFRGIEEGTFFASYAALGYASINSISQTLVVGQVANYIENRGREALPITNASQGGANVMDMYGMLPAEVASRPNPRLSRAPAPGKPAPCVGVSLRLAAVCSGLGEIGYSKMFLSKRFGPRQRVAVLLTDAEFDEYDPVVKPGTICDRCMSCVRACTGGCIPRDRTVKIRLAGCDVEWGDIDMERCRMFYKGADPQHNPFCVTDEDREQFAQEAFHGSGLSWHKLPPYYAYARPLEGASGCIRACMVHLEETGRIENRFHNRFRQRPAWRIAGARPLDETDIGRAKAAGGAGLAAQLRKRREAIRREEPGAGDS